MPAIDHANSKRESGNAAIQAQSCTNEATQGKEETSDVAKAVVAMRGKDLPADFLQIRASIGTLAIGRMTAGLAFVPASRILVHRSIHQEAATAS